MAANMLVLPRRNTKGRRPMKTGNIPFQFDLKEVIQRGQRVWRSKIGDVTLSLPFISVQVKLKDQEREVAREIVIRLKDRRVLNAFECCDNCIDNALKSLQEIRQVLVDKQVELAEQQDGVLYLMLEAMALGIRQFLTHEQRLRQVEEIADAPPDFRREPEVRQEYFDALEVLRGHLSRCLGQIANIAGMEPISEGLIANYNGPWQIEAYKPVQLPFDTDSTPS